jgi:hypothetical protein
MAKSKQQKREEALVRQIESVKNYHIPTWIKSQSWDKEGRQRVNSALITAAHDARCDRHGNYLDHRFYKGLRYDKTPPSPAECAVESKVLSLQEMKGCIEWADGRTLYQIAYGLDEALASV